MNPADTKEVIMPTGHVKFFDTVKGFGFVQSDEGAQAFLHVTNLPEGVTDIKPGTRVEYSVVDSKRGAQVLTLRILEVPESLEKKQRAASRMKNEDLVILVEGLIASLDKIRPGIEHGRLPEGASADKLARLLRTLADQLHN
jgi:cold shock protein